MSKKIVQSIVIILGIFIITAFLAVIYGMYLKISIYDKDISNLSINFSSNLEEDQKIKNIKILDKNRLLILIESDSTTKGAIYNIKKNKIIRFIGR